MIRKKHLLPTALATAALLGVGTAQADFVDTWNFTVTTEFGPTPTFQDLPPAGDPPDDPGTQVTDVDEISWGSPTGDFQSPQSDNEFNRSALTIGPISPSFDPDDDAGNTILQGQIDTNGANETGQLITHFNNDIDGDFEILTAAMLSTTLLLEQAVPPGGESESLMLSFDIQFIETSNLFDSPADCPFTSVSTCDDIFVIDVAGPVSADDLSFTQTFTAADGIEYTVNLFETLGQVVELDPAGCTAVGADPNCLGFKTPEDLFTSIQFEFNISAQQVSVPEPGTLALLGLGLAGLGFAGRRRRS